MNGNDCREIVQTVTQNVLTSVRSELASMKPVIVGDIVKQVEASLRPAIDSLTGQICDIQWRLKQLEQNPSVRTTTSSNTNAPPVPASRPTAASMLSPKVNVSPEGSTLLLQIKDWAHIEHNGWIFYANREDGRVYMVRTDGTGKTKLQSREFPEKFVSVVENGQDWIVKYKYFSTIYTIIVNMQ